MPTPTTSEKDPFHTPTLFEASRPGAVGVMPPSAPDSALPPLEACIPAPLRRTVPPSLPEVSELDAVRHYTRLSAKNFSIDANFYPLGSCTMKYNPRVNEVVAAMPGFRKVHPLQDPDELQGLLALLFGLQNALAEVSGLASVSLQPAAGAHGELTALMMIKAYHEEREPGKRTVILIPDSAHGTNPASCTIAGFSTREVKSGPDGTVDLADFETKLTADVAGMMITNPNTLGIFETNTPAIARMLHGKGAFLYMDGANMNAILGITRPGDMGVDLMHFNLHKTFSTPHGGGGPGAGPVAACEALKAYLPVPRVAVQNETAGGTRYVLDDKQPRSIGKVRSFFGNTGILVRAASYIAAHGPESLRAISQLAVLNANYLRTRLRGEYHLPYETASLHEVVFTAKNQQKPHGIRALDIAKRLLDLGFHAPTIYFPLVVHEALMIEPTETESLPTLDAFVEAMLTIAREARENPEKLQEAPVTRPVGRLDEVRAVKSPILACSSATGCCGDVSS